MHKIRMMPVMGLTCAAFVTQPAVAQSTEPRADETAPVSALLEGVVVTATKKTQAEDLQEVPASISAFGAAQLEAMQVRNIESLAFSMPNVALDALGTVKGVASFSIRGLGVNSSIPSIEPAVGTFVDGIYMGTNYGVVVDTFDLEAIEVLRGPQGVLFGRNVTGGAVSIRTRRPGDEFAINGRLGYEDYGNVLASGSIEGPLGGPKLLAKLTGYYNDDPGYFKNRFTGRDDGETRTWFVRPTLVFMPTDDITTTLIVEHSDMTGDGPVNRNPRYASKFETVSGEVGFSDLTASSVVSETVVNVGLGDGSITNIAGYREVDNKSLFDIDGVPTAYGTLGNSLEQDQFSDELRYAGRFGSTDLVTGLYYFEQDFLYIERTTVDQSGLVGDYGGHQDQQSFGVFVNADIGFADKYTLGLGGRYSSDRKSVKVNTRNFADSLCNFDTRTCSAYPFQDSKTFTSFTPRVMLKYDINDDSNAYVSYTKGYRSGGYNIRSQTAAPPGPFDDEKSDAYEVGFKSALLDRRLLLNIGVFYQEIGNLQRETSYSLPTGQVTIIGNAADARIQGIEAEITYSAGRGLVLKGSVGKTDADYVTVFADLNRDGVVDQHDKALKLPRQAPLTYSIGAYFDRELNAGSLGLQVSLDHRDASFFNDANTGPLPAVDNLYASVSFAPARMESVKFTVYGKNLLDEFNTGNNSPLAFPSGGNVNFPVKGRVVGGDVTVKF
ncbi:TonB-dependent receptor [Steroidobacter flavus]|uniref:TonB-dependent receptor n=1 Tax=Steroidobacter flavus TaxID=1842136 RepID=A0ABV8SYA1_9GAMM